MSATISPDRLFAALGDPTRLRLVEQLAGGGDHAIRDLAAGAAISRQALTKHLRVLEEANLVRSTRFGREVRFRLEQAEIERAQAFLAHVSSQWRDAIGRLSEHLAAP